MEKGLQLEELFNLGVTLQSEHIILYPLGSLHQGIVGGCMEPAVAIASFLQSQVLLCSILVSYWNYIPELGQRHW